jgi:phage terminase small subunit
MASKLTIKQEAFAVAYVETGNASEAYRQAYSADSMKPETIHKRASELLMNGEVAGRLAQLRAEAAARSSITVDSLLDELEEARKAALGAVTPQAAAAVSASMAKAKLLGMDVTKTEHTGANGGPIQTASADLGRIHDLLSRAIERRGVQ